MIVLGIDPGFGCVGWGVIEGQKDMYTHVAHGCIETSVTLDFSSRLSVISKALNNVIDTYHPKVGAVETLFFNKNVTTGIQVAHARGVILLTLKERNVPLKEVSPQQVKQTITGYGAADKAQVQKMLLYALSMEHKQLEGARDDAIDALAIAFTGVFF